MSRCLGEMFKIMCEGPRVYWRLGRKYYRKWVETTCLWLLSLMSHWIYHCCPLQALAEIKSGKRFSCVSRGQHRVSNTCQVSILRSEKAIDAERIQLGAGPGCVYWAADWSQRSELTRNWIITGRS